MDNYSLELRPDDLADFGRQDHEIETWLPVAELHCPPHPNCTAAYTFGVQKERKKAFSLKILGFGGGSSRSGKLSFGQHMLIQSEHGCEQILQKVIMHLSAGLAPSGGFFGNKPLFTVQLNIKEIPNDTRTEPLPKERDKCHLAEADPKAFSGPDYEDMRRDLTDAKSQLTDHVELTKTVKLWWGLPIELGGWSAVPVSLTLRLEGELSTQVTSRYEYMLAPGHVYLGVRGKNDLGYFWTTQ